MWNLRILTIILSQTQQYLDAVQQRPIQTERRGGVDLGGIEQQKRANLMAELAHTQHTHHNHQATPLVQAYFERSFS